MGFGAEVENFGRTESLMKKKEEKKGVIAASGTTRRVEIQCTIVSYLISHSSFRDG